MRLQSFGWAVFFCWACAGMPRLEASDCWLSAQGAGLNDGSSAANAYKSKFAQRCWDQTSADGTMHIMEGEYTMKSRTFWKLRITSNNDGSKSVAPGKFKQLTGEGRVVLEGSRPVPYHVSRKAEGGSWITITKGASHFRIQNFQVRRVAEGIAAKEGKNRHLEFSDLHFEDTRQNFFFSGNSSQDILIEKTSGLRYSKRHVRLGGDVSHVRVMDSNANADFLDGDFAVGFDAENTAHDLEFIRCTSRGNIYTLSSYWNGDGFKSEKDTSDIRWEHCAAFDNADGGFDVKTPHAVLENVIALRNNRNLRTWSPETVVIKNALGAYSKHRGGEGSEAGLWSQGNVDCHFCTFHNNQIQVHAEKGEKNSKIRLYDSILSVSTGPGRELIRKEAGAKVELIWSAQWQEGVKGKNPKFGPEASAVWEGGNREFDSHGYWRRKGYRYE